MQHGFEQSCGAGACFAVRAAAFFAQQAWAALAVAPRTGFAPHSAIMHHWLPNNSASMLTIAKDLKP
jgi:hypothetical protein